MRPVGSSTPVDVNVQFVSATNRNLARLVAQGRFRRDLYYRLSGIEVALPPLRDRGDDVLLLADRFVREFALTYRKDVRGWDASTESWLLAYAWPGNVRELRETLRVGLLRARTSLIQRGDLRIWATAEEDGPADLRADTILRRHLNRVLALSRGNLTRAGGLLGWERNKVRREARRLGVALPRNAQSADLDDAGEDEEDPGDGSGTAAEAEGEPQQPAFGVLTGGGYLEGGGAGKPEDAAPHVPNDGVAGADPAAADPAGHGAVERNGPDVSEESAACTPTAPADRG